MKKIMFIVVLFLAVNFQSFAGFDLLWYKNIPNTTYIYTVAFSNDSKRIVCETEEAPYIFIYDALTGNLINDKINLQLKKPFFSPDDKKIIGIMNNKFYSYDLATGTLEDKFDSIGVNLQYFTFSKNKKYLFAPTNSGFYIYDFVIGKIIKSKYLDKAPEGFGDMEYLEKTNQIISMKGTSYFKGLDTKGNPIYEYTRRINLYDFNSLDSVGNFYNKIENYGNDKDILQYFKMSNKQDKIALIFGNTDKIEIYEFPSMKLISKINISTISIADLKFTSDDKYLIIGQGNGRGLSEWEVETGKLILDDPKGDIDCFDKNQNDNFITVGSGSNLVVVRIPTTDITNPPENKEILYPNPTNGLVNIKVTILAELKISVNNEIGDIVLIPKFIQTDPNTVSIDLNKLANGIYFLNLTANNFNQTYKVIINK